MIKSKEKVIALKSTCPFCHKTQEIIVTDTQYKELRAGNRRIQDILYDKSPDEREALISGICPTCWDKTFGGH